MERRVKIVATLGPAVGDTERLRQLMEAGADMVRVNAAHGSPEDRAMLIANVREAAASLGKRVPILFDLRGLKIRTGPVPVGSEEGVHITRGSRVRLDVGAVESSPERIGINYENLLDVIHPGSRVLISDGLIELHVESVARDHAVAVVVRDGTVRSKQGVTLPGAPIKGGALTEVDREDVAFAVEHGVDFLGLSFLNDASDLVLAREVASQHGNAPGLVAKIERPEALDNLAGIIDEADGVMVARGDLGVQLPPERVPRAQKHIIETANRAGVPVITATQMLESMITNPVATRAETSDVANAVWDGTDAVMLSAETAVGRYPFETVQTMHRIICEVEREGPVRSQAARQNNERHHDAESQFADAIARAAFALSDRTEVKHLVVFTKTGTAVRRVAKYRPFPPIIAAADTEETARQLQLVWGVESIVVPVDEDPDKTFRAAGQEILRQGLAEDDEYVLIVGSLPMTQEAGRTNLVHVRKVGT